MISVFTNPQHQYAHGQLLPQSDPYRPWELRWLRNADTMGRYMRASKWNVDEAKKRIKATMEWRRDFKPDLIPPEEVKVESVTGKMSAYTSIILPRTNFSPQYSKRIR